MQIQGLSKLFILLSLFILLISIQTKAQILVTADKQNGAEQPIELKLDHTALGKAPTISVQIGQKTYPFLFDSGMGVTMITPEVAQEIGCKPFGQIAVHNAGGERVNLQRCENTLLKIDAFSIKTETAVFNLMSFFNEKTPQIGGAVSLHTFRDRAITIDLANKRLWIETEKSLKQRIEGMKELESRFSMPGGGAALDIFVAANTPNGKIWLEFDTGNFGWTHISPHTLGMLGATLDAPNKAKMIKPLKIDFIGLGTIEIPMRERNMIYDAQLNYDTIARMVVTIDLRSGKMWAKMNL